MPSVDTISLESLVSLFPLTSPIPTPLNHSDLLTPKDIHREEDLIRNPTSFRHWWSTINAAKDAYTTLQKNATSPHPPAVAALLGPLSTPIARLSLMRITYLYESALVYFPGSFKLWKAYLQTRCLYVLGKGVKPKRAGGRKKLAEMKEALEEEVYEEEKYEGGLDGVVGWQEWKSLVATFERALMWLPNMPRLWLMYLSIFSHPLCPAPISHTHARRTFDRALRTLPPSLHSRIWPRYLRWAESKGGMTTVKIYRRYLQIDPSMTEHYAALLLAPENPAPRPLEAAKLLLTLARRAAKGEYSSPEGKSPYQLFGEWLDVVEAHAEEVGMDLADADAARAAETARETETAPEQGSGDTEPASVRGKLIRFGGPPVPVGTSAGDAAYDADEDHTSKALLDIEKIVKKDGLNVYKDQMGRLYTGLATYWTKRGEFDKAKSTFEDGLANVLTIRDFTQIFDAYAEFSETLISALMDAVADEDADDEDIAETERDLDVRMKEFEELMDRRPFLVNEVLLRRNPNDVQEWEKRVALYGEDDVKVAETYTKALSTVTPRKATANFHQLYVNFAKFYEEGGASRSAQKDLDSARKVMEKATKVTFKTVEELAEVWCEWAEMELRHENYDEAIRVMQRATAIPKNTKISYHDQSLPVQARLFKSLKLWSFYVDLEESIGTVDTTKQVYDKILELKIANAQIIVNYAAFLEENKYFEESFKVYERGVEVFTYPIAFELWNIYLAKFTKRYGGNKLERARDLFEQALEKCPEKHCKPIFLMYAQLEEEHGLAKRAMDIYDRATQVVSPEDKFDLFTIYIAKASANFGLPATRPIYERAIRSLPDRQTAQMCLRFASLERKLGEIDRARAIYAHASQFCDPRVDPKFWSEWNSFEIETGSEDTFREMLRIKRSVQAQYNTEVSYLAAASMVASKGGAGAMAVDEDSEDKTADPMAMAERDANKGRGLAFVAATQKPATLAAQEEEGGHANEDEIQISDDEE
ncbi:hypothetical protein BOTBODRAFT_137085 [Botryobasidium botryosum FD-172 SS1]|uniref:Pre-mRNA-splicing factor SYF1 n=1 Tax=Botryobasidium botryosum (strain FD-172 SS1) TaxID=930990 RepID=A0A067M625_BOTB1|nr:hypothetical protein BOTBODRAFT_137085 [Botryobasidium botryosum FD-172 SS1]